LEQAAVATPEVVFSEAYVEADGFRIRYREHGRGEPLVCLHGAGGLRISRAHELLAAQYRVIAFEVPGFGESPANERSASMQELALTMAQAVTALGIERFNLMGSSFGGRLALWLAIQHPERIEALVLAAPSAIRSEGSQRPAGPADERLYAHPERQPPRAPLDTAIVAKQEALLGRLRGPARDPELESHLGSLNLPVLVLFGTLDRAIPPEMGRIYREKLPDCHFILVYDAGHAIDADRPEAFASVVGDFLQRRGGFLVTRGSGLLHP
jgi:pimeloyl-ACP methyl ester carboxylesterase